MRRLFALAFAVTLAGCSESYGPTAPDSVAPVPAAIQDPDPADEGVTVAAASYGKDDVPNSCNDALRLPYNVGSFDEINTPTDRDCYVFRRTAGQFTIVQVATPAGRPPTPVTCAVLLKVGSGSTASYPQANVWDSDPAPDRCFFTFMPARTEDWYVRVWGNDGAFGPEQVETRQF